MEKKKKKRLIIILIFVGLILIFVGGLLAKKREKKVSVYTAEVQRGDITAKISASGRVQPKSTVDISASVMGEIVKLNVKEGESVRKGKLLLQLDKAEYESRVEQATASWKATKANVKLAKANLEKAEQDLERQRELLKKNLTSQETVDAAETALSVQQATYEANLEQMARAEAALKEAKDALRKTTIYSPMDGIVSQLNAEEGEVVIMGTMNNPGTVIMTISDMSIMEVEAEVDESDIVNVKLGQEVEIIVDAIEDSIIKGEVTEIGNTGLTFGRGTQEEVTNFLVTVTITDSSEIISKLRPGMSASIDIISEHHENTLYVPIQSVLNRTQKQLESFGKKEKKGFNVNISFGDEEKKEEKVSGKKKEKPKKGVFTITTDETSEFVEVETGINDETHIEILSGLEEGEKVVAGSYKALRGLRNGTKLKVTSSPMIGFMK